MPMWRICWSVDDRVTMAGGWHPEADVPMLRAWIRHVNRQLAIPHWLEAEPPSEDQV